MSKVTQVLKGAAIASTLATMMVPGMVLADKTDKAGGVQCTGVNGCKGKGACKSASNDCKGQNACKGQGVTMMKSEASCTKKGGKVAMADGAKTDAKADTKAAAPAGAK